MYIRTFHSWGVYLQSGNYISEVALITKQLLLHRKTQRRPFPTFLRVNDVESCFSEPLRSGAGLCASHWANGQSWNEG